MTASDFRLPPSGQAALDFADLGWEAFPLKFGPEGQKSSYASAQYSGGRRWGATTDPAEIRKMFRRWPEAGVGIATGPSSGIFVLDIDTDEEHAADGFASLAALEAEHGPLPMTVMAESPSGGRHLYFNWPADGEPIRTVAANVAPGIDQRGAGGMVAAPPTVKPGRVEPYRWVYPPGRVALADAPEWLVTLCRQPSLSEHARAGAKSRSPRIDTGSPYGQRALLNELARVLAAPNGRRNEELNKAAFKLGQLVGRGDLDEDDVRGRLIGAGHAAGLGEQETIATVASGMAAGIAQPRAPHEERKAQDGTDGAGDTPDEADEIDLSHDALASDLGAKSWDQNARYVALWGQWLFWSGTHWAKDCSLEHLTRVRVYLNTRSSDLALWAEQKAADLEPKAAEKLVGWAKAEARTLRHASTVAAIVNLARSNRASSAKATDFDANLWLLGTPEGTVDLRTGQLRPALREDHITRRTSVAPRPGRPERWLTFLDEVFDGDQDLVAFMQRAAGYALTGETREHKLLFCYGTGRNGKSVFLNTLVHILGEYARRAHATTFLNTNGEKHPTDLAGLQGARLVVGSELPKGKSWDESAIKDLTGGDVITARFMRGDFFDYKPQFTLMIAGNTMPSFKGVDEALRARVVLVPFTVTIPAEKRDPLLSETLQAEAGQILTWAIEGALAWQRMGLAVPEKVAAASKDYLDGEDTVGQFLEEETVKDRSAFTKTTDLHLRFNQWAARQGLHDWTLMMLQKALVERDYQKKKTMTGNGFLGVRLR